MSEQAQTTESAPARDLPEETQDSSEQNLGSHMKAIALPWVSVSAPALFTEKVWLMAGAARRQARPRLSAPLCVDSFLTEQELLFVVPPVLQPFIS